MPNILSNCYRKWTPKRRLNCTNNGNTSHIIAGGAHIDIFKK